VENVKIIFSFAFGINKQSIWDKRPARDIPKLLKYNVISCTKWMVFDLSFVLCRKSSTFDSS